MTVSTSDIWMPEVLDTREEYEIILMSGSGFDVCFDLGAGEHLAHYRAVSSKCVFDMYRYSSRKEATKQISKEEFFVLLGRIA